MLSYFIGTAFFRRNSNLNLNEKKKIQIVWQFNKNAVENSIKYTENVHFYTVKEFKCIKY